MSVRNSFYLFLVFIFIISLVLPSECLATDPPPSGIDPGRITIVRDNWGVPHIFAKTDEEAAYGFAWVQAEDNFKDVQLRLLSGKGMLGQLLGKKGAMADYAAHLFRVEELVEERYGQDLSADFIPVLEAFAKGLNDFAEKYPKQVLVEGSFPVTPKEIIRSYVLSSAFMAGIEKVLIRIAENRVESYAFEPEMKGSNGIAVNSALSEDGSSYLVINPHQPLEGPFSWYEAHIQSEEGWNMLGATFPGAMVLTIGTNENLGWTHTVNHPDLIDIYELEINPENPYQYKMDGEWIDMEVEKIKLKVKTVMGINVKVAKEVLWTTYGPAMRNEIGTFAIRTPVLFRVGAVEQWFRMGKSKNFSDFNDALEMQQIPSLNVIYSDRFDTICYLNNGLFPYRDSTFDWKKTLPGNTTATLWEPEFHPLSDLPMVVNPESGYVFNTNNSPFRATSESSNLDPANYDNTMGFRMIENNRSVRFNALLSGHDKLSLDELKSIKYDIRFPDSIYFSVNLMKLMELSPDKYPDLSDAILKLRNWNRFTDTENRDAAVFLIAWEYIYKDMHLYDSETPYGLELEEHTYAEALRHSKRMLLKHFGSLDVPLGQIQRHIRGGNDLPASGFPDVLALMYTREYKKGKRKTYIGDSYVGFVSYSSAGVKIETMHPYGSSNNPGDPHYADQMELFVSKQTKEMSLKKAEIYEYAERIYSPGIPSLIAKVEKEE